MNSQSHVVWKTVRILITKILLDKYIMAIYMSLGKYKSFAISTPLGNVFGFKTYPIEFTDSRT